MVIANARLGELIDLPLGPELAASKSATLAKTATVELVRLVVPAGTEIPTHRTAGETTVQCLEGRVAFTAHNRMQELGQGQLLLLPRSELYSVRGIEDSSLLLTMLLAKDKPQPPRYDVVQEASEESFPASDSPSWTPVMRP